VVVIDDQPEVSIDDPSFLFESNEGFQEVTSRRAQKSKQKAALEEALKKSQEQQAAQAKRLDKDAKVPRCIEVSDMTQFITSEGYILAGEVVKHKNHAVCYTFLFFIACWSFPQQMMLLRRTPASSPSTLVVVSKCMWAVILCTSKIVRHITKWIILAYLCHDTSFSLLTIDF